MADQLLAILFRRPSLHSTLAEALSYELKSAELKVEALSELKSEACAPILSESSSLCRRRRPSHSGSTTEVICSSLSARVEQENCVSPVEKATTLVATAG